MRRLLLLAIVISHLAAWRPAAAEVTAVLEPPAGEFTVGDTIELKLTVVHPPGTVFEFPDVAGAFGRPDATSPTGGATGTQGVASLLVEEVRQLPAEKGVADRTVWSIRMRVFSPGPRVLPPVTVAFRPPDAGEKAEVSTGPVTITVASVLKSPQDDAADIKGQWLLPRDWWPWILGGLLALTVAALAAYLWRRFARNRSTPPLPAASPQLPVEPPYDRAMRELAALLASTLLASGRIKEFHVALSEIVRRFLGTLHGFDALDRTTGELLSDLARLNLPAALREETGRFLATADLVKFAKHFPEREEIDRTVETARRIIETGRPVPVIADSGVAA